MKPDDDTLRQNPQATEDAWMALLEAGQMEGMQWHGDDVPQDLGDGALLIHRVKRDQAEGGGVKGALTALWLLRHVPPAAHGNLLLSFDGWADDPRALCEVPEVVQFCQGLLFGAGEEPNLAWSKQVLGLLMDERDLGLLDADGNLAKPEVLDAAGGLWVVAMAHARRCFLRRGGGLMRDLDLNRALYRAMVTT